MRHLRQIALVLFSLLLAAGLAGLFALSVTWLMLEDRIFIKYLLIIPVIVSAAFLLVPLFVVHYLKRLFRPKSQGFEADTGPDPFACGQGVPDPRKPNPPVLKVAKSLEESEEPCATSWQVS